MDFKELEPEELEPPLGSEGPLPPENPLGPPLPLLSSSWLRLVDSGCLPDDFALTDEGDNCESSSIEELDAPVVNELVDPGLLELVEATGGTFELVEATAGTLDLLSELDEEVAPEDGRLSKKFCRYALFSACFSWPLGVFFNLFQ